MCVWFPPAVIPCTSYAYFLGPLPEGRPVPRAFLLWCCEIRLREELAGRLGAASLAFSQLLALGMGGP